MSALSALRVVLHAPTADAFTRALSNAANLAKARPDAQVELVVNAQGARAAVEVADNASASILRYCANSLAKQGLQAPAGAVVVEAAVLHLAQRQHEGWAYIRC